MSTEKICLYQTLIIHIFRGLLDRYLKQEKMSIRQYKIVRDVVRHQKSFVDNQMGHSAPCIKP